MCTTRDRFAISSADVCLFIRGIGFTEATEFEYISENKRDQLCSDFGTFVIGIDDDVHKILDRK